MLKKTLNTMILFAAALSSICKADVPNQVILHYTGTIIYKPCDISIGDTTILDFGDVDIAAMSSQGATTPWLNYIIRFSNCDVYTNIIVSSTITSIYGPGGNTFPVYDSSNKLLSNIGLVVNITKDGRDINMGERWDYEGMRVVITPVQRTTQNYTNFTLPIKFSLINATGQIPASGSVKGVYTMTIEYN